MRGTSFDAVKKGPHTAVRSTSSASPPPRETDTARVDHHVVAVAAKLNAQLGEITQSMRALLADRIQELRGDQRILELLGASIEGNVDTILHILQHDIPAEHVEPPSAAVEYARRLAQRGVPVNALVRAYRLGQDHLLKWSYAEIERQIEDPAIAFLASHRFVSVTFNYVDWISQHVVTAYETERERWLENRNTVRATRIREIIEGQDVDHDTAEAAIGYPLRQVHLGAIMWVPESTRGGDDLAQLEHVISALGRELSANGRPLFAACDRSSGWAWLPLGRSQSAVDLGIVEKLLKATAPDMMVALGRPESGIAGFRDSHRQALRAQRVALLAGSEAAAVTAYTDPGVRAAAMMCTDLEQTRMLVRTALGRLATDDAHHARLRDTLLHFLSTNCSYTATAELLTMHKNSVKYRVAKAQEELGALIADDRLDVELALIACRWLGRTVLEPAEHA